MGNVDSYGPIHTKHIRTMNDTTKRKVQAALNKLAVDKAIPKGLHLARDKFYVAKRFSVRGPTHPWVDIIKRKGEQIMIYWRKELYTKIEWGKHDD